MPNAPKRPCREPGCPNLSDGVYCPEHRRAYARDSAHARGYDTRWQRTRAQFLRVHPLCAECYRDGRVTAASVVDHIVPHRGDARLFWDPDNLQPMCKVCHDRKTGGEL